MSPLGICKPTKPYALLRRLTDEVAAATGLVTERVFLTPSPEIIGRMPPGGAFASVVPNRITFSGLPQHDAFLQADLHFTVCIYTRVAVDRALDGTALLTDPQRGLLPLADRVFTALSGNFLPDPPADPQGQLLRNPLQCSAVEPTSWAEGANLILAYVQLHYAAPFLYDMSR